MRQIEAIQVGVGQYVTLWVEAGKAAPQFVLDELLRSVDQQIYPVLADTLGDSRSGWVEPGSQAQLVLYDFGGDGITSGYFNPADLGASGYLPPHVDSPSSPLPGNGGRFVYVDRFSALVDPARAPALAAHEIAHMLLFIQDQLSPSTASLERRWVQEGVATYAELLAGYPEHLKAAVRSLEVDPGASLVDWKGHRRDYGAAGSFVAYAVEHSPAGFLVALAAAPADGRHGVEAALRAVGSTYTFDQLFSGWLLSLVMDAFEPPLAPYFLSELDVDVQREIITASLPVVVSRQIPPFGAVFLELPAAAGRLRVLIDGEDGAPLGAAVVTPPGPEGTPAVTMLPFTGAANAGEMVSPSGAPGQVLVVWGLGSETHPSPHQARISVAEESKSFAQFLDLDSSHRFYPYIEYLARLGLVEGKEESAGSGLPFFFPESPVLRAQFAKLVVGAFGLHTEEVEPRSQTFRDVPTQERYPGDYVYEAAEKGIVLGYQDGLFRPWSQLTRLQLVRMILRAARGAGHPISPYNGEEPVFADVLPGEPIFVDVMTAYQAGILEGGVDGDGRRLFWPYQQATRGHVSKMMANLLQAQSGVDGFAAR